MRRLLPLLVLAASPLGAQGRAFQLSDWYKITTLSQPAMSPDGGRVAFTVQTVDEKGDKYHQEVWVAPTSGGSATRFTSPSTESSNPRFSPDGKYLLFTSNRPGGKGSTWVLRMDGPGEAFQLDAFPTRGSFPKDGRFAVWADGDSIIPDTTKKVDPFERMQPMARPPFGAITKPADPARFDGRHITDMRFKANGAGYVPSAREARRWRPAQVWMQNLDGTGKKKLTNTLYSHTGVSVSPDGQWVAFIADSRLRPDSVVAAEGDSLAKLPYNAKRDEAETNDSEIFVMSINGGEPRKLVTMMGDEGGITWSPDGSQVAFVGRPSRLKNSRIYTVAVAGGSATNLLGNWQYEPDVGFGGGMTWLPSGQLAFGAHVGGRAGAFLLDPKTKALTEVIGGRRQVSGLTYDASGGKVAYVSTTVTKPWELFVADADGKNERRVTSFNDKISSEVAFSDAERFTYTSVGNTPIEGWLMKPYGYQPGKKYPLVLYIHGGPHSAYEERWFDEFQNLAAQGMWVLYTNPRGSSGYGTEFTFSTRGRWGAEDYQDLMKAVDIAAVRPDVDSTKMGVTGGSYGGFMTAWITTKTNRFKAAQTDRMISEWTYWYGASDAQGLTEFEFYGKPWDNFAMYDSLSPIRHVTKVRTPTLLVQSEEDFRTPMGNAELWFIALKKQGVPAEFVRYPRSTHELSRSGEPWLVVDRLGRLRQWFSYWLVDGKGATATAAGGGNR
ncbi:MAG: WD40-like beta Propeller containing protein [Gemmatimonadetes bacterium]|nr:WD40-like beta Propeller containing protein [Gemmatimonadota bacterium]